MLNIIKNTSLLALAASAVTGAMVYVKNKLTSCGDDASDVGSELCVDRSSNEYVSDYMQRDSGSQQSFSNNNTPYKPIMTQAAFEKFINTSRPPSCATTPGPEEPEFPYKLEKPNCVQVVTTNPHDLTSLGAS
jgi:hypothetical protein